MQCVLLAAGYATRLYPLTENMPKALLKLGDKTILEMVTVLMIYLVKPLHVMLMDVSM